MNSFANQQLSDEQGVLFFRNLERKLNGTPTQKMISLVSFTLRKVRGVFSSQQLSEIIAKAPSFIKWIGVEDSIGEKRITHLDELVELMIAEDQKLGTGLFKSEIETLRIAILILKQIQVLFERVGISILPYTLERELQGAMIGEME